MRNDQKNARFKRVDRFVNRKGLRKVLGRKVRRILSQHYDHVTTTSKPEKLYYGLNPYCS